MYYDFNAFLDAAAADPRIMTMAQSYFGDPKFIYEAAIRNPQLFAFARPELLNYPDLVFAIGEKQPGIIRHIGYGLRQDASFLLEFISRYPQAFAYLEEANPILYHSVPFITMLYQRNLDIANYASDDYKEKMLKDIPTDIVSRNGELIKNIINVYNSLDSYKDHSLTLENYYDDLWNKYLEPLSTADFDTLMSFEVNGKPLGFYNKKIVAFIAAGQIARRLSQAKAGEKEREEDLKLLLETIESEESYVEKKEVEEFYPKFGITPEMLKPYKKKKKTSKKSGKKSGSSSSPDEGLDRDDIALPVVPEEVFPSDYTLEEMVVSNIASATEEVLSRYRKKDGGYIVLLEQVSQQVKYFRQYIPDFDAMLAKTKVSIATGNALHLLKELEAVAVKRLFAPIKNIIHDRSISKADRQKEIDERYNRALKVYDEDVVRSVFYSMDLRGFTLRRIDKRNGYKMRSASSSESVSENRSVFAVAEQLRNSLENIYAMCLRSIDSNSEISFLKLRNQIKSCCKISPELGAKLNKMKCGSKLFNDIVYELEYNFCQAHIKNISKILNEGKYDLVKKEFNNLVMNGYPEEMIKSCCDRHVLNYVSLKRITYGRLTDLEMDREASHRSHNNAVESIIEQLKNIDKMRKAKKDCLVQMAKLEDDYASLSPEQKDYLAYSYVFKGVSFFDCFWTNWFWISIREVSNHLRNGKIDIAEVAIDRILAEVKNTEFSLEWIVNTFKEFGITIPEERYREFGLMLSSEASEHKPPETRRKSGRDSDGSRLDSSSGDRTGGHKPSGNVEIDYLFISSQVGTIYEWATSITSTYSDGMSQQIEIIKDEINKRCTSNPELRTKLNAIDSKLGVSVLYALQFSDCLNRLRFAREKDDKALEEKLAKSYGDIYIECCNTFRGRS